MSTSNKQTRREIGMLILGIIVMAVIAFVWAKGEPVGVGAATQDNKPVVSGPSNNSVSSTIPLPTPTVSALAPARKSYPLPEALATKISQLVDQRNLSERALLNYISDPKIYESQDETIRAAVFDRQSKLYSQFATSMKQINEWILAQRKEFKCATCEASQDKDGKWSFAEPELQGGKQ